MGQFVQYYVVVVFVVGFEYIVFGQNYWFLQLGFIGQFLFGVMYDVEFVYFVIWGDEGVFVNDYCVLVVVLVQVQFEYWYCCYGGDEKLYFVGKDEFVVGGEFFVYQKMVVEIEQVFLVGVLVMGCYWLVGNGVFLLCLCYW